MGIVASAQHFLVRLRYPVSLPQDVGHALGISISNFIRFPALLDLIMNGSCKPTKCRRFMERDKVEKAFEKAQKKEIFHQHSLYSFYFNQGWLEFDLEFDCNALLRRIYIHHKSISDPHGFELSLSE